MRSRTFLATLAATALLPSFCLAQDNSWGLSTRAINRVLEQATWGPTLTPPASLQHKGFDAWFAEFSKLCQFRLTEVEIYAVTAGM